MTKKNRKRLWLSLAAVCVGVPVMLLIAYLVVTSSFFLTRIALPLAGRSAGIELSAVEIRLSPLAGTLDVSGLIVGDGENPVVRCDSLSLKYDLMSLPGRVRIGELTIEDLHAEIIEGKDGNWNLAPLNLKKDKKSHPETAAAAAVADDKAGASLPEIIIDRVSLRGINAVVASERPGREFSLAIRDLNLETAGIAPGKSAALDISGEIGFRQHDIDLRSCKLDFRMEFSLGHDLIPSAVRLTANAGNLAGKINELDLAHHSLALNGELNMDGAGGFALKQLELLQKYQGKTESSLSVAAQGSIAPLQSRFNINSNNLPSFITGIAESYLNDHRIGEISVDVAGGFGVTGETVASDITCAIRHRRRDRPGQQRQLPAWTLETRHDLSLHTVSRRLDLRQLQLSLSGEGREMISARLSSPLTWQSGVFSGGKGNPALAIRFDRFPLDSVNMFTGGKKVGGYLNGNIQSVLVPDREMLVIKAILGTNALRVAIPGGDISGLEPRLTFDVRLHESRRWELASLDLRLNRGDIAGPRLALSGEGHAGKGTGTFKLHVGDINAHTLHLLPDALAVPPSVGELVGRLGEFMLAASAAVNYDLNRKTAEVSIFETRLDRGHAGSIGIAIAEPWQSRLDRPGDILAGLPPFVIGSRDMNLEFANNFLPENVKIKSGVMETKLRCSFSPASGAVALSGLLHLRDFSAAAAGRDIGGELRQTLDLRLSDYRNMRISSLETTLSGRSGQAPVLRMNTSGEMDLRRGSFAIDISLVELNEKIMELFMPEPPAAGYTMSGRISLRAAEKYAINNCYGDLAVNNLTTPSLDRPLDAKILLDLVPEEHRLNIKRFRANIGGEEHQLTDFSVSGVVALPLAAGKTELLLKSSRLDLLLLKEMFAPAAQKREPSETEAQEAAAPAAPVSEPPPVRLDADAVVRLELEGITYGPNLKMSCRDSRIAIEGNVVRIDPFTITVNGSPVKLFLLADIGRPDGYEYTVRSGFEWLNIGPLIRTFHPELSYSASGVLENFNLDFSGKGIRADAVNRNLAGTLMFETRDIAVSKNARNNEYVQLLFIPINILSKIATYIPRLASGENIVRAIREAEQVDSSRNSLRLETGKVDIAVKDGYAAIREMEFAGSFISSLKMTGQVPLDKTRPLRLSAVLDVNYLVIPLDIAGSPRRPLPDIPKMVSGIVAGNIRNIIDATPVGGVINEVGRDPGSLIRTGGKILSEGFFGPSGKQDSATDKTDTSSGRDWRQFLDSTPEKQQQEQPQAQEPQQQREESREEPKSAGERAGRTIRRILNF